MNKHRLVYLYVSNGSSPYPTDFDMNVLTVDHFASMFPQEGFCSLFRLLIDDGVFDEILVVIESSRSPGTLNLGKNFDLVAVPNIYNLKPLLRDNDIMWARGGWRSWHDFLKKWHDTGHWLLFYRAASNRGAWPFWDIVFDDLIKEPFQDEIGRLYLPINKPINQVIFYPLIIHRIYDVIIGASHIHDKKGQWRFLPVLEEYRNRYGTDLACIMPGGFKNGEHTNQIISTVKEKNLNIFFPGMVHRHDLNIMYNHSRLFVHCGGAGQNDRGPLEALCCGTTLMIANPEFHPPFFRHPYVFCIDPRFPEIAAEQLAYALTTINSQHENWRQDVHRFYKQENGLEEVVFPQFKNAFNLIKTTPHSKKDAAIRALLNNS